MSKKIFKVERTDSISYDEYDSCVIIANSKEEVIELINSNSISYYDRGKRTITEIDLNTVSSCLLVSSFNAG